MRSRFIYIRPVKNLSQIFFQQLVNKLTQVQSSAISYSCLLILKDHIHLDSDEHGTASFTKNVEASHHNDPINKDGLKCCREALEAREFFGMEFSFRIIEK